MSNLADICMTLHQRYVATDATLGVLPNDFKLLAPSHSSLSGSKSGAHTTGNGSNGLGSLVEAMIFRRISPAGLQGAVPVADQRVTRSLSTTQNIPAAEDIHDLRSLSS